MTPAKGNDDALTPQQIEKRMTERRDILFDMIRLRHRLSPEEITRLSTDDLCRYFVDLTGKRPPDVSKLVDAAADYASRNA